MLDAGALISLDRVDKRMIALLAGALVQGRAFRVPTGVGASLARRPCSGWVSAVLAERGSRDRSS